MNELRLQLYKRKVWPGEDQQYAIKVLHSTSNVKEELSLLAISVFPKASLRCLGSRLGVFREERGLSGRGELLGLELQKWHGKRLRRGSEV